MSSGDIMKEIPLTQGKVALVDDEDYERLNQFKWCAHKQHNTFYAKRWISSKAMINMHHEIIGYPLEGFMTDHENGNGLDNQRYNLRHVTNRQNCQNKRNGKKKTSQFPGVCWKKQSQRWVAEIQIKGKKKYLCGFVDENDAFEAYKQAVNDISEKVIDIF